MEEIATTPFRPAVPWGLLVGTAPFLFLAAQAFFTAQHNKEEVNHLKVQFELSRRDLSEIKAQSEVNQALLEGISKKLDGRGL